MWSQGELPKLAEEAEGEEIRGPEPMPAGHPAQPRLLTSELLGLRGQLPGVRSPPNYGQAPHNNVSVNGGPRI